MAIKKLPRYFISGVLSGFLFLNPLLTCYASDKPLSNKEILAALMKNLDVPLKGAVHCDLAEIDKKDVTIGDYLSGLWAEHVNPNGKNWLAIDTIENPQGYQMTSVKVFHKEDNVDIGRGVSFLIDKEKKIVRSSFSCVG